MVNTTQWGRNKGCAFWQSLCIINQTTIATEFCAPYGASKGCTNDAWLKATCTFTAGTPAFTNWDYFSNGTLSFDGHSDNCPFWSGYASGDCRVAANNKNVPAYQEAYGPSSRCFSGFFAVKAYKSYATAA